jgi:hypothetical protein
MYKLIYYKYLLKIIYDFLFITFYFQIFIKNL